MIKLKCPKCGETEEIYYIFDEEKHGIKCEKCGYEIRGCESVEEAEFKWKSKSDPKALRPCPFCGSEDLRVLEITDDSFMVVCHNHGCFTTGPEGKTLDDAIEKWNRRV